MNTIVRLLLLALLVCFRTGAHAHEIKWDGESVNYSNWRNGQDVSCCNNQDCNPQPDREVRYSPRVEVRVEGEWCEVKPHHYLKRGNAANANVAHVCVQKVYADGVEVQAQGSPCERLLCFQPKPLF